MSDPLTHPGLSADDREWIKENLKLASVRALTGSETLDELRALRCEVWEQAKAIADRACEEGEINLSRRDRASFDGLSTELDVIDDRIRRLIDTERARGRAARTVPRAR